MSNQIQVFSSIFKEEYLERLVSRNEEFRKFFLNLSKFLSENYRCLELFGKSLQKIVFSLDDYINKFASDDKNCYYLAKTFCASLNSFGEDSSKLFNSLSNDVNLCLVTAHDGISMNRRNHLDLLTITLSTYCSLETEYLKTLAKYKTFSKEAEDSLFNYHESLKEAKTIYNLSLMNRNLSKVQKIVNKTMKYESKLKNEIHNVNGKRKELVGVINEALASFKACYKLCLGKLFEVGKKHVDALSSFMSLFSQTLEQKKEMLEKVEFPENLIPNPEEFKLPQAHLDSELLTETHKNEKEKQIQSKEDIKLRASTSYIPKPSIWPDFLEHPEKVSDMNLVDYCDWIQNYVEKYFTICKERRKILKHVKMGVKEFADEHENTSRLMMKGSKNISVNASWNAFGEQLFAISQLFPQIFDAVVKKMFGFANFTQIKVGVFESILMDIQRSTKIGFSTASQALKDHMSVRNSLIKLQSSKNTKKNFSEIALSARKSITETAQNIRAIVEGLNKDERKRIDFFKDNLVLLFSQMEYYYLEIFEYLKGLNEKFFRESNGNFLEDTENLFFKLIYTDSKLNEMFKSKFKEIIQIEKDKDIEFKREFDPDSNPLYLKIIRTDKLNNNIENPSTNNNNNNLTLNPQVNGNANEGMQSERSSMRRDEANVKETQSPLKLDPTQKQSQSQESLPKVDPITEKLAEKPENIVNENKDELCNSPLKSNSGDGAEIFGVDDGKASFSNLDSPMVFKRKKSQDSNDPPSPGLEIMTSPGLKIIKPFKCEKNDEIIENPRPKAEEVDVEGREIKNSWEISNSPKKKKSTYSFFRNKLGITQGEVIDSVYSCAFSDKMLVQGKMFISNKKIGFHSYFNKHTFIGETKMIIPKNDIIRIEKRYNALIFDNSIAIITPKGELFFTSFVFRDKAYISIVKVIKPPEQRDLEFILNNYNNNPQSAALNNNRNPNDNFNNLEEKKEGLNPISSNLNNIQPSTDSEEAAVDPNILKKLEERANMVKEVAPKLDFFSEHEFKLKVPSTIRRVEDVYRILFASDPIKYKGKEYQGFWEYLKVEKSDDIDYSMTQWNPPPPKFYQSSENIEELVNFPYFSERKVEFTHPVRNPGIPFMPKTCPVKDAQKLYWVSNTEFRMVGDVRSERVPYTDCFFIRVMYIVKQLDDKSIEIICRFKVVFVKSTVLKGTLEKRVSGETIETTSETVLPTFAEFLKAVYPSEEYQAKYPHLMKRAESVGNVVSSLGAVVPQMSNDDRYEETAKKLEACKKEITGLRAQMTTIRGILIALVVIDILHWVYLLTPYFFS